MSKCGQQSGIGQQPAMTPQMQQAFRLLQLHALELQSHIQQVLDSNVMLETDEAFDATWALESEPNAFEHDTPSSRAADGGPELRDDPSGTLHDHLAWQLELEPLPNGPRAIGRALIDAINDDGYLTETTLAIAGAVSGAVRADAGVVESVLAIIQKFDPAGVGARSVSECIGLQLAQLEPGTPGLETARMIARHHLELAEGQKLKDLQRLTGCSGPELEAALALLRSCHRRPGVAFQSLHAEYVVPDVFAQRTPEGWTVELNQAATPRVRLNERYAAMITGSADHAMLRAQLQEARWLVRSLEIRDDTVLRIARTIVERQKAFLDRSEETMRPLILQEVAEAVDMHESAVSRVTSGKYLHTPRGVLEFRLFFGSGNPGVPTPAVSRRFDPSGRSARS
ncbi:MAG: RNA polymerase factor sigma-54 [Steroidobacteraceae bacterium]